MRKILLFIFLLIVTAAWMVGCGDSGSRRIVTPNPNFVFLQDAGGGLFTPMLGAFTVNGNTTTFTATAVTDPTTNEQVQPAPFYSIIMSQDGTEGTFDLFGGLDGSSNQWDIWVANTNGVGNAVQITNDAYDNALPQFSPDGTKVVFTSDRSGNMDQVIVRSISGSYEQIPAVPAGVMEMWAPTYSPDGTKFAMESWGYDTSDLEFAGILVMNTDGSNAQLLTSPLTTECYCFDTAPSYTADGMQIAFARVDETNAVVSDIYIMNADGTGVTNLTDGVGVNFDPLMVTIPGGGEKILFASNRDNLDLALENGMELYMMNKDGSGLARLTTNTVFDAFWAAWYGGASAQAQQRVPHAKHRLARPAQGLHW
ncbi:MAG TPA: hypothetical protein VGS78_02215 [Candidatus Sulfotelmatobacter sp.]|nr:hypothetical protein [Candidatus Sulfotelmatobacter sp.]